jgi:hypothetical protein
MPTASAISGQQLDEPGVWQLDKRLVVLLARMHLLLPERHTTRPGGIPWIKRKTLQ